MIYHSVSADDALRQLGADKETGLSDSEAAKRAQRFGENIIAEKPKKNIIIRFFSQFKDFMILILLAAAVISFATSALEGNADFADPVIILIIVTLNAVLGLAQECKAERSLEALRKMSAPTATVKRGGRVVKIPSGEVVPGDILVLRAGDAVAADCRLISARGLQTDESALTGESQPCTKNAARICAENTPLAERSNMLYASSSVLSGKGEAVAAATGMDTEVGRIAGMIMTAEEEKTPLQKKLASAGKALGTAALLICAFIFAMGLWRGAAPFDMFLTAVSLAVAAIPEGLPAIVTIMLAIGVQRMVKCGAVVRHLPSVETLGGADVICTDKTGTLTKNKMKVTVISSDDERLTLELACMCADGSNPTENALIEAAAERGIKKSYLDERYPRTDEVPFSSEIKHMRTVHRYHGNRRVIVKGAVDVILNMCTYYHDGGRQLQLTAQKKREILAENERCAADALRVIGVAYSDSGDINCRAMTFTGLVGMTDPPRDEVYEAVRTCKKAGIRVIMITGDHVKTAAAIAAQTGICASGAETLTGAELDKMTDKQLDAKIETCSVFARTTPEHKMRIVKSLKRLGHTVAMTGDGVNDAPALKAADIGCSMGICGTEVAKSASDMVLTDDNFATIVEAVRCGRGIFENVRKAVKFLLSSNTGEIMTIFSGILFGWPSPLTAIQLLWVNLVTDSLPAIALGLDRVDRFAMEKPPRKAEKSLFADGMASAIILEGAMIGALALAAFSVGSVLFDRGASVPVIGRTMAFSVLSMSQLVHAFNMRSEKSLFSVGVFGNMYLWGAFAAGVVLQVCVVSLPPLARIFGTAPLSAVQWAVTAGLSLMPFAVVELQKRMNRD